METENSMLECMEEVSLDGVPEEIKFLPLGIVHNTHQDFLVDKESCQAIIEQFKARKLDLVIDYEHQTLKDIQAPAAGWITELYIGKDALMARVKWTDRAREYLKNREYRYLSPVVMVRKKDRKAVAVHSGALTNTPAIDGMFAVVNSAGFPADDIDTYNSKGGKNMDLKKLAQLLGLPEESAEEDLEKALEALVSSKDGEPGKDTAEPVANSTILTMLGLKKDARTEDVTGKIQQLKNGSTDVALELQKLKEDLAKKEAGDAVETALKEGKISAAQKEWASDYALKDLEGFKSFLDKAVAAVPMGKTGAADAPKTNGRVEIESEILKNLGLTKEELEKYAEQKQ